ncbi:hypothetical protein ACWCQS_34825 [Streptomyces sp. NPDC002076]
MDPKSRPSQRASGVSGAGDLTGDRYGDLLARDKTGALWLYPGTGTTAVLGTRIKIGTGWGIYNTLL